MNLWPGNLRIRLTLAFALMFAASQLVIWLAVDFARTKQARARFDRNLLARAEAMAEIVGVAGHTSTSAALDTLAARLAPFESDDCLYRLEFAGDSGVLESAGWSALHLPEEPADGAGQASAPDYKDVRRPAAGDRSDETRILRMVTLCSNVSPSESFCLQVARDATAMHSAIQRSRQLLILSGLVSLILGSVTCWLLAGRSLEPLSVMAKKTRRISAARLATRFDAPVANDEIGDAIDAVNEMLDRLEREFQGLERFVSNISHELKTPLAALLAEAHQLRPIARNDAEVAGFVDAVDHECRRLLRRIEAFLILAQAKAQTRLIVRKRVSIEDLVMRVVRVCQHDAQRRHIRLAPVLDAEDAIEPIILGDEDLLSSMLENLIRNAIRHSPAGAAVSLEVQCTTEQIRLAVRDRGPGIPPAEIEHIFDRFHQVDPQSKRSGSVGLGLSVVRTVVALHEGSVSVRNMPDGGCEFAVTLPRSSNESAR